MSHSLIHKITIPQHGDARGQLSVAEIGGALPFVVRRVYWIHGTQPGVSRGFHAHRKLAQLAVCVAGSVRFRLFNGEREEDFTLTDPALGVLISPMIWHEMHDFSPDCVLMVFADTEYDEADYIRDRAEFIKYVAR
jgi:dTDP-4-dehydrorhamnose 3,5-epimerase-like enzyme